MTLSSLGTTSGDGPRCQETIRDTIAQNSFENVSKHSNDSLLARGNTLQSDEERLKLDELMAICTTLQNRVLDLEKTKTTQHNEIASLKRRVKKLEKKKRSRTRKLKRLYKVSLTSRVESSDNEESLGEDASKQERIDAIDADEEITLVSVQNVDEEMFVVNVLDGEEVFVAEQEVVVKDVSNVVSTAGDATTVSVATTTTATITTLGESTTTISSQLSSQQSQDKGKGILIEHVQPMKKKDLVRLDEDAALKLQAEFDKEESLAREKAEKEKEANIALIETWDDIQAKIEVDEEEVTINDIPLAVKSLSIVGWKIHKEGRKSYYQIIRADEKSQMYMIFSKMLKSFDRQDLEDFYKLVKAKYKSTRLVEDLDLLLWGDLKTMFEPHVEDKIWRNQQDYKVLD
ncbi:hypothetical protein Tco_1175457 [Tanacetum coccineum]